MLVETEARVYMVESLVAEIGETLGLFVDISFITFWDVVEFAVAAFQLL